jgi:hypothetical protein
MEQARRSALAHHVHRTAPMGSRVLINGIWYYLGLAALKTERNTKTTLPIVEKLRILFTRRPSAS